MKMAGSRKAPYTRETPDVLDRVFEWAERIACPMDSRSKRMLSEPKEDVLDFVFQHVESFVCQEDAPRQLLQGPNDLERGNSLVERGIHGQATVLQTRRKIKKLGVYARLLHIFTIIISSLMVGVTFRIPHQ